MFSSIRGRILVILAAIGLAVYAIIANGITPGLDLSGGMHLALEVADPDGTMTAEAMQDATDRALTVIRNRINEFGVAEPLVQKVGEERIIVELPGLYEEDEERAKAIIEQQAFLEWKLVRPTAEFARAVERLDRVIAPQLDAEDLRELPGTEADTGASGRQTVQDLLFGTPADTAAGDTAAADTAAADTAASDTAGTDTAADTTTGDTAALEPPSARPLSSLLLNSSQDGELWVAEQDVERVDRYLSLPGVREALPRGTELRWAAEPVGQAAQLYRPLYFLEREPFITGESLVEAVAGRDPQFNETIVTFELDRRGGRTFSRVTSEHLQERIAIVLDEQVHSAPIVQSRIGSNGQIEMGQATMQEASDLALVLRAGSLPAPLEIVEQRSVGPSLGQDSIDQGKIAGVIGVVLVIGIMIGYYRLAGAMAVLALLIYGLFVMGGLAGLGADFTAPGIAGLILSLGMAVDANVLIFERIREELIAGRSPRAAVDAGFQHAMSAIVDSNLTTLITALILYQVGTGPVQGFAVTLSIGIVASFFTAVFITRTFFLIYLDRKRAAQPISI
ncbi:MAG: protein translocase subunit SecD [Longimicrobiales bacterium]